MGLHERRAPGLPPTVALTLALDLTLALTPALTLTLPLTLPLTPTRRADSAAAQGLLRIGAAARQGAQPTRYVLATHCLLCITYYALRTTHYLLLVTYSSLVTTHYALRTTHYSLRTAHHAPLRTTYYLLLTTYYLPKVLNFSIAYGKTAHGLSKDWGVTQTEAQVRGK